MSVNETEGETRQPHTGVNGPAEVSPDLVQQQLEKILSSKGFVRSERLSRFLRFTVTATLRGESDRLKEYAVGLEVFDRDGSYDPRIDPIVRVQARLLRAKLEKYYADEGTEETFVIELPTGGYVPVFRRRQVIASEPETQEPATPKRGPREPSAEARVRYFMAALVLLALVGVALIVIFRIESADRNPGAGTDVVLRKVTSDPGLSVDPALSPDGRLLAYASDRAGEDNLDIWVQQTDSGQSLRLTSDPADECEPNFSPDGTKIAFRSERYGGGIYVVSAIGGEPRLLVSKGRQPRFSSDGKRILYWTGNRHRTYVSDRKMFLIPANGGAPLEFQTTLGSGSFPAWLPDGKHVIFAGYSPAIGRNQWYAVPGEGEAPTLVGLTDIFDRHGLKEPFDSAAQDVCSGKRHLVFAAQLGDSTNLWKVAFSSNTWPVEGDAQRLTFGTGVEVSPSIAGNRLAFASLTVMSNIWAVPADTNRGLVRGHPQPLISGSTLDSRPSLSATGEQIAFTSGRAGNDDVWIKDRPSGKEVNITRTPANERTLALSRDGRLVAYAVPSAPGRLDIYAAEVGEIGKFEKLCENCGYPSDWSADGKYVIYTTFIRNNSFPKMNIAVVNVASHQSTEILAEPAKKAGLWNPSFSPDGRWIAFIHVTGSRQRQVYIAPFHGTAKCDVQEWVRATDGSTMDEMPRWSPDGNLLYFLSDRDGYLCIWAQRLDPQKHSLGDAFPVHHFHSAHLSLANLQNPSLSGFTVGTGEFIFALGQRTGNIWMMTLPEEP